MPFINFKLGLVRIEPAGDVPGRPAGDIPGRPSGINFRELDEALNNVQPEGEPGVRPPEQPLQDQEAARQHCINVRHIVSVNKDEQKCTIRVHTVIHSIDVQYLTLKSLNTEWRIILAAMPDKFLASPNLAFAINHIIYLSKQPIFVNDAKKYAVQFITSRHDADLVMIFETEDEQKNLYNIYALQLKIN